MVFGGKVVLELPISDGMPPARSQKLEAFVEQCLTEGVELIAVVGDGCKLVENIIDEIVVGEGSDETRYVTTSSHPGECLEEVVEFANVWTPHSSEDRVDVVRL